MAYESGGAKKKVGLENGWIRMLLIEELRNIYHCFAPAVTLVRRLSVSFM